MGLERKEDRPRAEVPEVKEEVQAQLARINGDVKKIQTNLEKRWADYKAEHKAALEGNMSKAEMETLLDRHATGIAELVQATQDAAGRMDKAETAMKRTPRAAMGGENKLLDAAIQWKRTQLALQKKLEPGMDVASMVNMDEMKAYGLAHEKYLRKGAASLTPDEQKALSAGSDPDGGYLVKPEVSARIITIQNETSPMRQLCSVESIGSDSMEFYDDRGNFTASRIAENVTRTMNTATSQIGKKTIAAPEIYAAPKATGKLLEDSLWNLDSWAAKKIGTSFSLATNTEHFAGTGKDNQGRGILTYASGTSWGQVEQQVTGANAGWTYAALVSFISLLKERYLTNATWLFSRLGFAAMLQIADGDSSYVYVPEMKIAGFPGAIAGFPFRLAADMPNPAEDALAYALGDWREAYTIVDRLGISIQRDDVTVWPDVYFKARMRTGSDVTNFEAFKIGETDT